MNGSGEREGFKSSAEAGRLRLYLWNATDVRVSLEVIRNKPSVCGRRRSGRGDLKMRGQSFDFAGVDSAKMCGKDYRGRSRDGSRVPGTAGEESAHGAESLTGRSGTERLKSEKPLGGAEDVAGGTPANDVPLRSTEYRRRINQPRKPSTCAT
jgi:hypothetical protein